MNTSIDIVQRLRGLHADYPPFGAAHEAADEITRLRAVVADFEQTPGWREYRDENKRLTAERDMLVLALEWYRDNAYYPQQDRVAKEALAKVKKP